jgi:Tfp pilus assembly protein PilZ
MPDLKSPEEAEAEATPRRDDRVTINKEFESYDSFINEYVTNISRTGVFVRSKTPLEIGTKVNLRFTVIMDDIETIEGVGEVVRVHDDPPGMGVVFTELSGYSKGLIEKLLTNKELHPSL